MERKFGIELEIVGINRQDALTALQAAGITVRDESYNHRTRSHWKLVSDSSVSGGFEVVSPVLQGEAGIEEAMAVAEALADAGATVNRTCGFHVHFDAADLGVDDVRAIMRRYAAYEAQIDEFMPVSRRGNGNSYCRSVVIPVGFQDADTIDRLAFLQGMRYYKVNLQSYRRHGTIEFRQHSGTVNARKIAFWVRFLGEFIDQCKRNAAPAASAQVANQPALSGVQGRLANMLAERGVVTVTALCEAFGWQAHTARAAVTRLRRAGLTVKAVTENGAAAYRLVSASVAVAAPADDLWLGISASVRAFYQRRAAVLNVAA